MKKIFILLFLAFLIPRLVLISYIPMKLDECLYAVMIEEQIEQITLIPTFLGYETGWKPPVFFWVMAFFVGLLKPLGFLSIDAIYKLPNILFGFVNLVLVYHIIKHITKDGKFAVVTSFVYALTPLTIYVDASVLLDPLSTVFILGAIYSYLRAGRDGRLFLLAGACAFLAFFTKQVNALIAPVFALAYYYQHNRKIFRNPFFIMSLLAVPAAFLLNYFMYSDYGQAATVFTDIIANKIIANLLDPRYLFLSLKSIFFLAGLWIILSLVGFYKNWKNELAMSVWFILSIFAFVGGSAMPWYFLPVMPAIAYFATLTMAKDENGKNKLDLFFVIGISSVIIISIIFGMSLMFGIEDNYGSDRTAGKFLASKENVLIIGGYAPGTFGYKIIEEKRLFGKALNFGLVLMHPEQLNSSTVEPFIENYYGPQGEYIADGNFVNMFFDDRIYRKDTKIEKFNYIVLVDLHMELNGTLVFDKTGVMIYKMN